MNNWNPDTVIELLLKSANIAMYYYNQPKKKELKEDKSIVTIADRSIETMLAGYFDKPEKESYMIGEETANQKDRQYITEALKNTAWIVDPIDGTVPYANNIAYWGTSIGYAEKGIIKEGALYFPVTGEMFITYSGKVYYKKLDIGGGKTLLLDFEILKKPERNLTSYDIVVLTQSLAKRSIIDIPNPVLVLCCATASFAYVATGKFMAYIGSNIKLWDYAASLAILKNLEFKACYQNGNELSTNISENHVVSLPSINWGIKDKVIIGANDRIVNYIREKIKGF